MKHYRLYFAMLFLILIGTTSLNTVQASSLNGNNEKTELNLILKDLIRVPVLQQLMPLLMDNPYP